MTIKEELTTELHDAMRQKDVRRRELIRMIETEVSLARSAPDFTGEVDDDLYRKVMAAYAKKMDKARTEYVELGERGAAMAEQLAWEVDYLGRWLPTKLDEAATLRLVQATISDLGVAGDPKAAGRVIGQIMKTHRDDVDGALVNRLVASELSGND
jgi:uncharacterized protein YqeY